MSAIGKIIGWLLGIGAAILGGLYLLGSRPEKPPVGDDDPWLTEYEAYEDQTAHTSMDGGAFVTSGLRIRDPREICREEGAYTPETYAIRNGSFETLQSGEAIYVRHADGMQRRSVWVAEDKCFFVDESGCKAHDIFAFDGYYAGPDGTWDPSVPRLMADARAVNGRKYREERNPEGVYLQFEMAEDGSGSVRRVFPGLGFQENYASASFGRGAYALENPSDSLLRAHLVLLPDGRTAIFSQAGETCRYILE